MAVSLHAARTLCVPDSYGSYSSIDTIFSRTTDIRVKQRHYRHEIQCCLRAIVMSFANFRERTAKCCGCAVGICTTYTRAPKTQLLHASRILHRHPCPPPHTCKLTTKAARCTQSFSRLLSTLREHGSHGQPSLFESARAGHIWRHQSSRATRVLHRFGGRSGHSCLWRCRCSLQIRFRTRRPKLRLFLNCTVTGYICQNLANICNIAYL